MLFRAKSGMSTILGMLIFVGVLFTCVIPLFLYINKVNSYYDRAVIEMREFDQDKERESIDVYAYPISQESGLLNIYVRNKCPIPVRIVRVWVNHNSTDLSCEIAAMAGRTISIDISELLPTEPPGAYSSFYIKVSTNRGNRFASLTNPLYYTVGATPGEGSWSGGAGYSIHIVIKTTQQGTCFFNIEVTLDDDPGDPPFLHQAQLVKRPHETSCFTTVTVTSGGQYSVAVKEKDAMDPVYGSPFSVNVDDTNPSAWLYVDADLGS